MAREKKNKHEHKNAAHDEKHGTFQSLEVYNNAVRLQGSKLYCLVSASLRYSHLIFAYANFSHKEITEARGGMPPYLNVRCSKRVLW